MYYACIMQKSNTCIIYTCIMHIKKSAMPADLFWGGSGEIRTSDLHNVNVAL